MNDQKQANAVSLKISPLTFSIDASGGTQTIKLENNCKVRVCFKVKTTNVQNYKMSKIFGFVEAGKSTDFLVTRTNGAANKDRFVVEYCAVEKDVTDPTQQFKKTGKAVNSVNIYCNAVSNKSVAPSFAPAIMRPVTSTMLTSSVQPDPDKSSASTQLKSIYTPTVMPKE